MSPLWTRAASVVSAETFLQSLRRVAPLLHDYTPGALRHPVYNSRETYTATIDGHQAEFASSVQSGGAVIRSSFVEESELLRALTDELEDTDVLWDVGANLGLFACFASNRVTTGRVVAVEPNPQNAAQLRENLDRNGGDRTTVVEVAVSDTNGTTTFHVPQQRDFSPRGTLSSNSVDDTTTVDVSQRTLERLVAEEGLPEPTVMKVDIEGAEAAAVRGFDGVLDDCRTIFSEVHLSEDAAQSIYSYGMDLNGYKERLASLGYSNEVLSSRGSEVQMKSVK